MPLTTLENVNLFDNLTYMQPRVAKDEATVGYYKTQLQNGVTAEISASMHAGIMKYQFPKDSDGKYVLVDISHFLPGVGKKEQQYSNGYLERSEDGAWYSGYTVFREGWAWGEIFQDQKNACGILTSNRRRLPSLLLRSLRYHALEFSAILGQEYRPILAEHNRC